MDPLFGRHHSEEGALFGGGLFLSAAASGEPGVRAGGGALGHCGGNAGTGNGRRGKLGGKELGFLRSRKGTAGEIGEAEGCRDAAGITAIIRVNDGTIEKDIGDEGKIGADDDGAGGVVVNEAECLQADPIPGDPTAILNETLGVDLDDGSFDLAPVGGPGERVIRSFSGSPLKVRARDGLGNGGDEGDFSGGSGEGSVVRDLVAEKGEIAGGCGEIATIDQLAGTGRALVSGAIESGQRAQQNGRGVDITLRADAETGRRDQGERTIRRDGSGDPGRPEAGDEMVARKDPTGARDIERAG